MSKFGRSFEILRFEPESFISHERLDEYERDVLCGARETWSCEGWGQWSLPPGHVVESDLASKHVFDFLNGKCDLDILGIWLIKDPDHENPRAERYMQFNIFLSLSWGPK